ncbi:KAP family P-loop NTPase fold protein [Vibrio crassostreae]|uniref:KAP family P-loop NTPase fold protein n=1 Tax=Vibrio crassostreae TaxID=246167 RepID=UPI0011A78ECF|nr:P-loop NTPase fold protein [Vibrio crassostreae]
MSILDKAKYEHWGTTHNFENCKLNRKEYGEFLSSYLVGETNGFVLNLNGAWGAGKTEFLKRIYTHLLQERHPVIYIDAWESDFSKEPLTVITSELLTQLESFNNGIGSQENTKRLKQFLSKAIKATAVGVVGYASKKYLDDSTIGSNAMMKYFDESPADFMKQLTSEYSQQIEAIQKIRECLSQLAEVLKSTYGAEIPVVVLVDELDRCRPTYAIEMLEVIKHFFKTDNFVFLIATDTDQLSHSINAVYGYNFDSKQYLKKFFDRKATLPSPDIEAYLNAVGINYEQYSRLRLFPIMFNSRLEDSINKIVSLLAVGYDLHIRDIDQLMNKFQSCLRSAMNTLERTGNSQYINFPALLIGLIEHEKSQEIYNQRTQRYSPEPTLLGMNYDISEDFTLLDLIKQSMNNITYTRHVRQNQWGEPITTFRLPSRSAYRDELQSSISQEYQSFILETINNMDDGNGQQCKYWNWDDMKKVIELAGTLE